MVDIFNKIKVQFLRLRKIEIVNVFYFTSISTFIKMIAGLISSKVVSILIGPQGLALIGQLSNFSTILCSLASGGINTGVTKYVAENKDNQLVLKSLISTALKITIYCSLFITLILIIFNRKISGLIFSTSQYGNVFVVFGIVIIFYALNNILLSIINGFKQFKLFVIINIAGNISGMLFMIILIYFWGLNGALVSIVTYQSVTFIVTLFVIKRLAWANKDYFFLKFDKEIIKKYLHYSFMAIITVSLFPLSQIILRKYIISTISGTEAGWWEAIMRISNVYLSIITTSFGVYYLPRLSEIKDKFELRNEIIKAYKIIIPILFIGLTIIYFTRYLIIRILFSFEFLPMEPLFLWQLTGDFFKILSWILSYLIVAKAMTTVYITTEIIFSGLFLALSFFFIKKYGIVGITQAYLINYIIYGCTLMIIFRKLLFINLKQSKS